jgi:cysteinyl-tRNA synthetase
MKSLGLLEPDEEPKATEYVSKDNPAMQKFIQLLIDRGVAYVSGGDVYFDITKAKDYGKLSKQDLGKMESGSRVAPGENKKNPLDFALWKSAKPEEPSWDSPWGKGRPGWHIECSVMSSDKLGDEFDIHGGGIDLIFPHHENEIAQSEGAGKKFAKYWLHHGLLTINGQKMAKSLGNFITIKDFLNKYKDPDILKLFFLSAHYSHPIDYTEEKVIKISSALQKLRGFFSDSFLFWLYDVAKSYKVLYPAFGSLSKEDSGKLDFKDTVDNFRVQFEKAMDDDFNTWEALATIFKMRTFIWNYRQPLKVDIEDLKYAKDAILGLRNTVKNTFSLSLDKKTSREIEEKKSERKKARKSGDYHRADRIRLELEQNGYTVVDNKDGSFELF